MFKPIIPGQPDENPTVAEMLEWLSHEGVREPCTPQTAFDPGYAELSPDALKRLRKNYGCEQDCPAPYPAAGQAGSWIRRSHARGKLRDFRDSLWFRYSQAHMHWWRETE